MKLALIDVGSNSIRTMTAERVGDSFGCSDKQVHTTRLAAGLADTGRLSPAGVAESLRVISAFADACAQAGLPVYAYATSAVRDASDRGAFIERLQAMLNGRVRVLSGREEARFAYDAAACGEGGMIDIGGGSTQIVTQDSQWSFPIGCVRAKDFCPQCRYAAIYAGLEARMKELFSLSPAPQSRWTGVGGTIATLAACKLQLDRYDRVAVHGARIARTEFEQTLFYLDELGADGRRRTPLLTRRWDVVLHGGAILVYLMNRFEIDALSVSDTDGMEGYARKLLFDPDA